MADIKQIKRLGTIDEFRARLTELGIDDLVGADADVDPNGALAQPLVVNDASAGELTVGNRFCVLPMEGWDGTLDGRSIDLTR